MNLNRIKEIIKKGLKRFMKVVVNLFCKYKKLIDIYLLIFYITNRE
ncbi:MAG: hypothetical protein E6210_07305 [Clostridioides difficile]|nr:hypothetical protein [Clostridioides difficile]